MAEYTKEFIEKLREEIKRVPKKPKPDGKANKAGVIKAVETELRRMQDKGYVLNEISQFLSSKGLAISKATLTAYLKSSRKARVETASEIGSSHKAGSKTKGLS